VGVLQLTTAPTDVADITVMLSTTTGPAKTAEGERSSQPSLKRGTVHNSAILKAGLEKDRRKISISRNRGRRIDRERVDILARRGIFWDRLVEFTASADSI
jgi:hypothetical protein